MTNTINPVQLTGPRLIKMAPNTPVQKAPQIAFALDQAMNEFGIKTIKQRAMFLAQLAHESGHFQFMVENLNYSAQRLCQVWPRRFPTLDAAAPYARNPEALANKTYGGRMGNTQPGDGWKYRGRGFIQLTGRSNYKKYGQILKLPLETNPELAESVTVAARIAAAFWANSTYEKRSLNDLAQDENVRAVTRAINGGENGIDDRTRLYKKGLEVLVF